jgi:hypothetical protein
MTLILSGTDGLSDVDGSASTPAIRGTDTNTGIFFPAADTIAFSEGGVESMRLNSSGNLGIGTSSPTAKLTVVDGGNTLVTSDANGYVRITVSGGNAQLGLFRSDSSAGGGYIGGNSDASFIVMNSSFTERARIDSSGRLLVGTTSSPTQTGGVVVADDELFVYNIPTTASAANCHISSGESNRFYRSTSALKYKQDIRDLESIDISKFRPVRFKSKCENDDPTKDHFGFIADEIADAGIEELVIRGADGEVDGFQYDRLTVVLMKAIQEQQALIQSLTARIAALEAKE